MVVVAALGVLVLGCLALFQVALAAGAPWGRLAWGGQHVVLPPALRVGSAVSVLLYAAIALVVLAAADGAGPLPGGVGEVGIWVLVGYFTLGVGMNAISRSRPERLVMTPVAAVLAGVCLVLALG